MSVPVFIPHWNRAASCGRTVSAFREQSVPVEVVVIDNASSERERRALTDLLPAGTRIRALERNAGFGPALNVLLREWLATGGGDRVVLAAHDALPHRGCLEHLSAALDGDPRIGIASAWTGYPHAARFTPSRGPYLPARRPGTGFEDQDFPHGTLLMVRRACLEAVGPFDERFFAYGCEIELGLRARRAGWRVGVVWDARVDNPETTVPSAVASYLQVRNALCLSREWSGPYWGLFRSLVSLANTARLAVLPGARPAAFSTTARLRAVRDAWLGHMGPPVGTGGASP